MPNPPGSSLQSALAMREIPHALNITRTTTELPPCVVQIHPLNGSVVLVGTYLLDDTVRRGSLDVYLIQEGQLNLHSSHATESSILDLKISPHDPSLVLTAQSTGSIIAWHVSVAGEPQIKRSAEFQLFDKDVLVLALCFAPEDSHTVSATLSSGEVVVLRLDDSGYLRVVGSGQTHLLESWTSAIGSGSLSNVLFSGGDDSLLAAHDMRLMSQGETGIIWMSMKLHQAGVTSILPSSKHWMAQRPHLLLTGGYDDHLRSIDLRVGPTNQLESYLPPTVSTDTNMGGGVWRLVPSPVVNDDRVFVCCMYEGGRLVAPDKPIRITRAFSKGHESMVYGGDWTPDGENIVTCSFYDKQLQLWSSKEKEVSDGMQYGEYDSSPGASVKSWTEGM